VPARTSSIAIADAGYGFLSKNGMRPKTSPGPKTFIGAMFPSGSCRKVFT